MKPRLLIADGDADLCHVFQEFLAERGDEVETAVDGLSCLEKVRWIQPAALLLDRELTWGGGDGVLAWLREERTTTGPAVVLTATAGYLPDVAADINPPVVKFLPKPFALRDLLESLQTAVATKRREDAFNRNGSSARSELFLG